MARWLVMLLAGLLVVTVLMAAHGYLWWRIFQYLSPTASWRNLTWWLAVGIVLCLPLGMAGIRLLPIAMARYCAIVTYSWLGLFFLLMLLTAGADLLGLVLSKSPFPGLSIAWSSWRPSTAWPILVIASTLAGYAHWIARQGPVVHDVAISLPALPAEHDGFTIVQISDLHVAPLLQIAYVQQVVAMANQLRADLVVLTGDLVDGEVANLAPHVAPLAQLQAKQGVYWITGNHEYYSGAHAWQQHFQEQLGIPCLSNRKVLVPGAAPIATSAGLQPAAQGQRPAFELAGINDYSAHRFGPEHAARLDLAVANRRSDLPLVLLAHQPQHVFAAAAAGVDLMLSGHTHGGQIWPFGYLVRLVQPHVVGLARFGPTQLYVNRGTGYWGPPMRLWARAEMTKITLRSGPASPVPM